MKKIILISTASFFFFISCKKEEKVIEPKVTTTKAEIPFTGNWSRQFQAGPGNLQTAKYLIYQDSIRYILTGAIGQSNYVLMRDKFILEDNRFIGHNINTNSYYLIFVKNVTNDSISLYKQIITTVSEGLNVSVPSDTTTQNYGWNTFKK